MANVISTFPDFEYHVSLASRERGSLTVKEGIENLDQFAQVLTDEQHERIRDTADKLVFSQSASGVFSIAKYIEASRVGSATVPWPIYVWNLFTSHRASAFLWRLFQNALPDDQNVQRKDIYLVSKCVCCSTPAIETHVHLSVARSTRGL